MHGLRLEEGRGDLQEILSESETSSSLKCCLFEDFSFIPSDAGIN